MRFGDVHIPSQVPSLFGLTWGSVPVAVNVRFRWPMLTGGLARIFECKV
jgi:hypothetical protein